MYRITKKVIDNQVEAINNVLKAKNLNLKVQRDSGRTRIYLHSSGRCLRHMFSGNAREVSYLLDGISQTVSYIY